MNFFIKLCCAMMIGAFSITGASAATKAQDEAAIRAAIADITKACDVRDAHRAMASYAPDVHVFDLPPPLQQIGTAGNLRTWQLVFDNSEGHITFDYSQVKVVVINHEYAYSTSLVTMAWKMKNGGAVDMIDRTTDIWKKIKGKWLIVHEHNSVPVDFVTGKAVYKAATSGDSVPFEDKK